MSYQVTFWTFAKKTNSTKQPTAVGTVYTCEVMDGSGILNPTIKLQAGITDPFKYNYAKINVWLRYYFVSNWRYDRGLWWADLKLDVLSSWKDYIGYHTGYVLRSSSVSDGNIKDTFYPAKTTPTRHTKVINLAWDEELSDGTYVVGIVNGDNRAVGSVGYYVMTPSEFRAFCNAVYANTNDWMDTASITDISTELLKTLFNPFEYIVSCMWFPITVPVIPYSPTSPIPLGFWTVPASCQGLLYSEAITAQVYSVTPDQHPQAATRGAYLNSSPYTTLNLTFQPFGDISLDASLVCGNQIDLTVYTDYVTGIACLYVQVATGGNDGTFLGSQSTQLGVPIQISGRQPNIASMISGGVAAVADALPQKSGLWQDVKQVATNLLGAPDISGTVSKIASQAENGFKRLGSRGSNGSRAQILSEAFLSHDFMILADEDNAEFGRPLYAVRQINTLSGFVQMGEGHIEIPGLDEESSMLSGFLTSGFFYE